MNDLVLVVPCYNEQECVRLYYNEVADVLAGADVDWRVCYVDDGSTDDTLREMKQLADEYANVRYVSFSRNFGKEAAIYAGLHYAGGDIIAVMDCDMQDPPALLPEMLKAITEDGYDSVATYRVNRNGEPPLRSAFATFFYRIMNSISGVHMKPASRDYRMMTRRYADALLQLGEVERFSKGLFQWVGFDTKWIAYQNVRRAAGRTKWSFVKLLNYAIGGIVAFSTVPLRIASWIGIITVIVALVFGVVAFQNAIRFGLLAAGFSVVAALVLFTSGVITFLLGVIGEYLARIYSEVKRRPLYIVREGNIDEDGQR